MDKDKKFKIFMICDMYESGVGKGLEGNERFRESPCEKGSDEGEAYRLGFEWGFDKRTKRLEQEAAEKEASCSSVSRALTDVIRMPPKSGGILPPVEGWEERSYYEVNIAFNEHNPLHTAILFSGFLNGKEEGPGGYNKLFTPTGDEIRGMDGLFYLEVVRNLGVTAR